MTSLDDFAQGKLAALDAGNLRRRLQETARTEDGITVIRNGRRLVSFSCNDYLNLSQDTRVKRAATGAIERYGTSAGASRLVTGNHPLFGTLEARLASLKGAAAALVFGSGYLANIGTIAALVGPGDLVLVDALAHACILAGARLAGAAERRFRHNDAAHLAELLIAERGRYRNALIVTERVFSMDGDVAPLDELSALAARSDAWLMTDDAHGLGVLPQARPEPPAPLQMGTLSKALGSFGGYLCASEPVVDLLRSRARSFVYATGLPPASVAAAIAALDIIAAEPERMAKPLAHARAFAAALGLPEPESCIVPVILGDAERALDLSRRLEAAGYLVVAIRPPTVAPGTARLRITFTAGHRESDIAGLAEFLRGAL